MIIAIDGPAASGKGTLARNIAKRFKFAHLDTGMLYRGLGYAVLQNGGDPENEQQVKAVVDDFVSTLDTEMLENPELRNDDVGSAASKVAAMPFVRQALLEYQRHFGDIQPAAIKGVVLDGRDIGTVVCPKADIKVFVTADQDVRAGRRFKELHSRGIDVSYDTVLADIQKRDDRDSGRKVAPMKPARDAFILDTSDLNSAEALSYVIDVIRGQLLEKSE
ncbi:MAG: (d)CMP kinase [Pseudomonadota bacterium]